MAQVMNTAAGGPGVVPTQQPNMQVPKQQAPMYHIAGYNGRPLTNTPGQPAHAAAPHNATPITMAQVGVMTAPMPMQQAPMMVAPVMQQPAPQHAPHAPQPVDVTTIPPITAAATAINLDINNYNLANTKEKTPMCLINELARHNKIQHQYTLTDEQGPAHKKVFYVKLLLGEEEYAASGPSIKKAQHAAAAAALQKTTYKHPPPKPPRKFIPTGLSGAAVMTPGYADSITPTVELNALVMKRGEPAVYRNIEMPRPHYFPPPNLDFRGIYNQRYHYPRYPRMFYVSLKIGQREFIGEGNTRQAARHNAAQKALKVLSALPLPNQHDQDKPLLSTEEVPEIEPPTEIANDDSDDEGDKDGLKSEISLVHEIALKRLLPVNFEVIRESGPPHMRTFVTRCIVGNFITEGEGNGKKVSKKRAAERMLEDLNKLVPLPPSVAKPKRAPGNKKKNRNLIKTYLQSPNETQTDQQKADPNYGIGINPISRLIQIQQAKKEKEPVYTLVAERGMPRRREFVMQVQVGENTCTGVGPNKKLAKRNAAEAMLQQLGYSRPSPQPAKPAIRTNGEAQVTGSGGDKKVTFVDQETPSTAPPSRQLVPGVLLMPDGARIPMAQGGYMSGGARGSHFGHLGSQYSPQTTATIAKELLDTGASPTAEGLKKKPALTGAPLHTKAQLLYLADVLGFQVQFTDFPKGNKSEYLSLVSLSTNPPQVSHGAGPTIEASHDAAALTALKALSEIGIDSLKKEPVEKQLAAGDGPHVKVKMEPKDSPKPAVSAQL